MAARIPVPASLHLDHCPSPEVIEECLDAGWNSILFDGSELSYDENLAQTRQIVRMAHARGAAVEGELETVGSAEEGTGRRDRASIDRIVAFVRESGIDSFAPAIGTVHGIYTGAPKIDFERVSEIAARVPVPLVIHGGTGLSAGTFKELIRRGASKFNISTQLKIALADGYREYLAERPSEYDPVNLLGAVKKKLSAETAGLMRIFESAEKSHGIMDRRLARN
jgi:fructose-bisphosphate aldolase class II